MYCSGLSLRFNLPGGASPCHMCIISYLIQILKTSRAKPRLKSRNLSLLYLRILEQIALAGPCNNLQKYLALRISSLPTRGSVPQNKRTIAGLVERGQLIRVFNNWVCKCSNFLAKEQPTSGPSSWL